MTAILRGRAWPLLGVLALLSANPARAQNLDAGKSGAQLFAGSCSACHHSARGLSKGRFRLTLYMFLQDHYASNSSSAWELANYLDAVDGAPKGKARGASPKHASAAPSSKSGGSLRPPAAIPQH